MIVTRGARTASTICFAVTQREISSQHLEWPWAPCVRGPGVAPHGGVRMLAVSDPFMLFPAPADHFVHSEEMEETCWGGVLVPPWQVFTVVYKHNAAALAH